MKLDLSLLLQSRHDCVDQPEMSKEQVRIMGACTIHYDLNFGLVLRLLAGKYTAEWRDVKAVIASVEPYVSESDRDHIACILTKDCPTKLVWGETAQNKETLFKCGHSQSIKAN